MAAGLGLPGLAAAESNLYPTYVAGPQPNGSWVVSSGQIVNPAGTQVNLGIRVRAKAVALNPNLKTHTAAVLTMGTSTDDGNGAVEVFDTKTGVVVQNYIPFGVDSSGSYSGIAYSADGNLLVFSQDSSNVTVAKVNGKDCWKTTRRSACRLAADRFLHRLFSEQPSGRLCRALWNVLYPEHFLSWWRCGIKRWRQRIRFAEPERHADSAEPENERAGDADSGRQRTAQHLDQQRRLDGLRQQRGWPGCYCGGFPDLVRRH